MAVESLNDFSFASIRLRDFFKIYFFALVRAFDSPVIENTNSYTRVLRILMRLFRLASISQRSYDLGPWYSLAYYIFNISTVHQVRLASSFISEVIVVARAQQHIEATCFRL